MKIGILLLKTRKERRLSQNEVAEHVGVCQSAYCAWESGHSVPKARYCGALAALLGIELKDLLPAGSVLEPVFLPVPTVPPASPEQSTFNDELFIAQQKTIALQEQWIAHLELENEQLQQQLLVKQARHR